MPKHDWIVEVCADLLNYAKNHQMQHLEKDLRRALVSAQHDMLLASVDAVHDNDHGDYAVLGSSHTDFVTRPRRKQLYLV